jgi:hypothetical protein
MASNRKAVRKVAVVKENDYTALETYFIQMNEVYKAARKAGFSVELALAIIADKSYLPDWMTPSSPDIIDPSEVEDEEDD